MRISIALTFVLVFAAVPAAAAPSIAGCPIFPADNYWNTPVDALPLHPSSATWVSTVGTTAKLHADWGNVLADNYGIPFTTVTGTQPLVPITADFADESDPGPFPIPPSAPIEGGPSSSGDRHVLVIDATSCVLYELYSAYPIGGGASWDVGSAAKFPLTSNALRPAGWTSADAAGLPIFPGLVRYDEAASGNIEHAIRFTAQRIWGRDAGGIKYLWPARHNSGTVNDPTRPPMGARFRLKASYVIPSTFDPVTQAILRAMKKYGLVLADGGSNWFFQGVSDARWPDAVFSELGTVAGSNFEVVDTSALMVDANSAQARQATVSLAMALASNVNPSVAGQVVTLTATLAGSAGTPTGTVTFLDGTTAIAACNAVAVSAASAVCSTSALSLGSHSLSASYSGDSSYNAATSNAVTQTVQSPVAGLSLSLSPAALDFGGESMGTTSQPRAVTVSNNGTGTVTVTGISASAQFAQSNDCTSLAPAASCTVSVTFSPSVQAVSLDATTPVSGTLAVSSNAATSPDTLSLAGTSEKSLVTHYYEAILRRAPDGGGKAFWRSEALRMQSGGANPNEAWYAMSVSFFTSPEYASLGRDDTGFVTGMYATFFNRPPDGGGLAFWSGQLAAGEPREVVLASFLFSPEFTGFAQGIFGNTAVRPEIDVVMDFNRGALGRLPDNGGLAFWVKQFRTAQCQGAAQVYAQASSISGQFFDGAEYAARHRSNAQYVGDLYNAFLRRGGDATGVRFWIDQLDSGGQTRDQVRGAFLGSPEFAGRVNAVVQQACLP
jgi:hypothetical protein